MDMKISKIKYGVLARLIKDSKRMHYILRAIRFSAQLGFDISDEVIQSIIYMKSSLNNISRENQR